MKQIFTIWFLLFLLWFLYRLFFRLPEWFDELLIKPLVFVLLPLNFFKLKTLPGFEDRKKIFEDILIGIGVGFVFAVVSLLANKLKYGSLSVLPIINVFGLRILFYLFLSFFTAGSEEILGRGLFFKLLSQKISLFFAAFLSSLFSLSFHLPILATQLNLQGLVLANFLITVFLLSMVNSYLYQLRQSLVLPILLHVFWNMSVALYL